MRLGCSSGFDITRHKVWKNAHSPDLAPLDYLFPNLKKHLNLLSTDLNTLL
jgi:hypothetical protein